MKTQYAQETRGTKLGAVWGWQGGPRLVGRGTRRECHSAPLTARQQGPPTSETTLGDDREGDMACGPSTWQGPRPGTHQKRRSTVSGTPAYTHVRLDGTFADGGLDMRLGHSALWCHTGRGAQAHSAMAPSRTPQLTRIFSSFLPPPLIPSRPTSTAPPLPAPPLSCTCPNHRRSRPSHAPATACPLT